jgi:ligand-binding sensor domain-containing protein
LFTRRFRTFTSLLLFTALDTKAQEVAFDHISVEQGLSNVTVTAILQDHQGFMWFGTLDGLCRYDGYDIITFRNNPADTTTISDNVVWSLFEDAGGTLWAGTFNGGLNRFDRENQRFIHYKNDPGRANSLSHNTVRVIHEDRSGHLWIGTYGGGLARFDPSTGEFTQCKHRANDSTSISQDLVLSIAEDSHGLLWIGMRDSGVSILDVNTLTFHRAHTGAGSLRNVTGILFDKDGTVWVGSSDGLVRIDARTERVTQYANNPAVSRSLGDNNITWLQKGDEQTLWVATFNGGLNQFDLKAGVFTRFLRDPGNPTSLSDISIRTLYKDRNGTLWVGTSNGGVNKANTERKNFRLFRHDPSNPNSLSFGEVWSIYQDKSGYIWIGTSDGGLNMLDMATGRFTHYRHQHDNPNSLSSDGVAAILEDGHGDFWVGTRRDGGLDKFDGTSGQWTHFRTNPSDSTTLSRNEVSALVEDTDGTLWVGTWGGGLNRFDRTKSSFTRFLHDAAKNMSLSSDRITAILGDNGGNLWVATEGGGVNLFQCASGECTHFKNNPTNPYSISNDRVYALHQDATGTFWFGTASGLNRLDRNSGKFTHYTISDGLASDYVRAITEDDRGNLWLNTTKGVTKLNPETRTVKNYDVSNGLQGSEFSRAHWKTSDGMLLLGGNEGMNLFHPDSITDNEHIPPVVLTRFNIFEKPASLGSSMLAAGFIRLSYGENFFSFTFAALDYANPLKNKYAYRMEGFDRDWVLSGDRRYASYTHLDPGEYVFRVKGSNNDGIWNEAGAAVRIIIDPPFWQTWWFRILVLVTIVSTLLAIHNYRVAKLLELERMRVRIASDLHDDIGSSLSSIALITDMVRKSLTAHEPQQLQLADASRAARHTADALKDIVWIITPEHDKLDDITLRMKDSAAKLLIGTEYTFQCSDHAMEHVLDMEFRRNVLLVYKETLNNIAKYARATKVDIVVGESDGVFTLRISDNGMGFDLKAVKKGNGLNNLKARTAKIGGTIDIQSAPGQGTTILLTARIP